MTETTRSPGLPRPAIVWIVLIAIAAIFALCGGELMGQQAHPGKAPYDKWCAGCHGDTGAGDGVAAAFMLPRPRDFTRGDQYQIRTTSDPLPSDADILRVIDEGMPGTAMPGWRAKLTERERTDLVAYLKSFSPFFANARPQPLNVGRAPGGGDEAVAEGRQVFEKMECFRCHGQAGRGDGTSAPTLTDDREQPIRAADLTQSWRFNGGSTVEQIYTRLQTAMNGTPMPSFAEEITSGNITEQQLWRVAQYVRSLSPEDPPAIPEVLRAVRADAVPASPDDSAWNDVESQHIPLVGQIIVRPRWFAPAVEGVWVQAVHDGQRLAVRVRWNDRSRSPDPAWNEWHGRMQTAMANADSVPFAPHGPDLFTVQFPARDVGGERPFFLGGTTRRPVYLWRWMSTPERSEEAIGTKLGTATARSGAAQLTHAARFVDGQWQLQFTRPLASSDTAVAPSLPMGQAIPIAFFASDGSNGEDAVRTSVSSWYSLYLDVPTSGRVYAAPLLAMALTAGLGAVAVRNAQRRREPNRFTSEEK